MWRFANDNGIRRAIHARSTHEIGRFDECSDRITYTSDRGATMLPVHADLLSRGACPDRRSSASVDSARLLQLSQVCARRWSSV